MGAKKRDEMRDVSDSNTAAALCAIQFREGLRESEMCGVVNWDVGETMEPPVGS